MPSITSRSCSALYPSCRTLGRRSAAFGAVALVLVLGASGCSGSSELRKLPPGVCEQSGDCLEGERCNLERNKCEDIYFPRREIKPY